MVKKITFFKTGLLAGTFIFFGQKNQSLFSNEKFDTNLPQENKIEIVKTPPSTPVKSTPKEKTSTLSSPRKTVLSHISKRTHAKVYHRFEEIPEIKDIEAHLYNKDEYTYIINADAYQKNATIELKRVLKSEVTKANTLSLIYRSECHTYNPKETEDQLTRYNIDLKLINPTGTYKGPSQMDDQAITNFIRFLGISPEYRDYITPILKNTKKDLQSLEKNFYKPDGSLQSQEVRQMLLESPGYKNIKINTQKWAELASSNLKKYISKKEAEISRKNNQTTTLSNTTKTYLYLTELFPDKDTMVKALEDYNLTTFPLNRQGKPKHVLSALALNLNLTDKEGNLDATRIPTYVISATLSHINWKGNGRSALKDIQKMRHNKETLTPEKLKKLSASWVSGKSNRYGINEISKLNIITEDIIKQYQNIELPGANNLALAYQKAVQQKEEELSKIHSSKELLANNTIPNKENSLLLTLKNFIHQR